MTDYEKYQASTTILLGGVLSLDTRQCERCDEDRPDAEGDDDREWDRFKEESTPEELAAYEAEMDATFEKRDAIFATINCSEAEADRAEEMGR